ncbi:hypothetical protein PVK06_039687 [Gossypium arboreum]|uniref:Uncharacterized protein n=1 Tax=Gossypium arboreum TaxID=29729 RepID=A0ABR0N3L1_GOSAR|nr:hypothetical protein PVK06_039687 [Gossypium arboreum]
MEWIIRWMQWMKSLGMDYTQQFGIPISEPALSRYIPMPQASEEWKEEEEDDDEEGEEKLIIDNDFNEMFRLEQPSNEGVKIRTPRCMSPTSSAGARAATQYTG